MFSKFRILLYSLPFLCLLAVSGCQRHDTSAGPAVRVLFDQSHGQRFLIQGQGPLDLADLAAIFDKQGCTVTSTVKSLSDAVLAKQDVLVISGPFAPITTPEIEAVSRFLEHGGRLCIMLHIAQPAAALLEKLSVAISNGVIREQENLLEPKNPLDFRVASFEPHPITAGLRDFNIYGAWALLNISDRTGVIARTGPKAWIDLNKDGKLMQRDAMQAFGVIVTGAMGRGRYAVFGDDAIFQNQFLKGNNKTLAGNLVGWLKRKSVAAD